MKPRTANIPIAQIRRDGGTQARAGLNEDTVVEYAEILKERPLQLPPVLVMHDGAEYWLVDGFHRVEAAQRAGLDRIAAEVSPGTQREAILAACGCNYEHGLRRSNADKRRAVETLLDDAEWRTWSDAVIARATNVSRQTVSNIRAKWQILPVELQRVIGLDGRERTRPAKDSTSGQPTSVSAPAENPTAEGEEGAGVPAAPASAEKKSAAPAPPDPRDRLINVERMLRDAQAEIGPLIAKGAAIDVLVALNEALSVVRRALAPAADGFEVASGDEPDAPIPFSTKASQKERAEVRGGRAEEADPSSTTVREEQRNPSPEGLGAQAGDSSASPPKTAPRGWPEPTTSPRRGMRVILETPDGDVPFEDISQAESDNAG